MKEEILNNNESGRGNHTVSKGYQKEINRRRTFAIISHPDAGKTTLTEKLLLLAERSI